MRVIDLPEIKAALDLHKAIEAIKSGFIAHARGEVQMGAVGHLSFPASGGDCHIKSAALRDGRYFVVKVASGFSGNAQRGLPTNSGLMLLFDAATGHPVCLLRDEGWLTDLRTAIAGMLAASLIKPERARRLGIIGTGVQARLQAELVPRFAGFEQVSIWGRNYSKATRLSVEINQLGIKAAAVEEIAEVTRTSDVLITTTSSRTPLVDESMLGSTWRIVAVGADMPGKQELSPALVGSTALVVADSIDQCLEHGELATAHRQDNLDRSRVATLGDLLAQGVQPGADEPTIVDLTGLGVQDLQIASLVWDQLGKDARAQ